MRAVPRARRDAIDGVRGDRLLVRVTAAPVDGRANLALERLLAKALGLARGKVTVVAGEATRDKLVRVEGLTVTELERRLATSVPR